MQPEEKRHIQKRYRVSREVDRSLRPLKIRAEFLQTSTHPNLHVPPVNPQILLRKPAILHLACEKSQSLSPLKFL